MSGGLQRAILIDGTTDGYLVSWITPYCSKGFIEYNNSRGVNNIKYPSQSTHDVGGWRGCVNTARLDEIFHPSNASYKIFDVGDSGSDIQQFSSIPAAGDFDLLKFAVISSTGTSEDANLSVNLLLTADINLLVGVGDLSYADGNPDVWNVFGSLFEPILKKIPLIATPGDHEIMNDGRGHAIPFRYRYTRSNTKFRWYSVDKGLVHFCQLDSDLLTEKNESEYQKRSRSWNRTIDDVREQYQLLVVQQLRWLNNDLQNAVNNRNTIPWIVVSCHYPIYSSLSDSYNLEIRTVLEPLLLTYAVDLVLSGHNIHYERTFPVSQGLVLQQHYNSPKFPVYVVVGSSGGGIAMPVGDKSDFTAFIRSTKSGFVQIAVNKTVMDVSRVEMKQSTIIDQFVIIHKNRTNVLPSTSPIPPRTKLPISPFKFYQISSNSLKPFQCTTPFSISNISIPHELILIEQNSLNSKILTTLTRIILEQKLGVTVKVKFEPDLNDTLLSDLQEDTVFIQAQPLPKSFNSKPVGREYGARGSWTWQIRNTGSNSVQDWKYFQSDSGDYKQLYCPLESCVQEMKSITSKYSLMLLPDSAGSEEGLILRALSQSSSEDMMFQWWTPNFIGTTLDNYTEILIPEIRIEEFKVYSKLVSEHPATYFINNFQLSTEDLSTLLHNTEGDTRNVQLVACNWLINNPVKVNRWFQKDKSSDIPMNLSFAIFSFVTLLLIILLSCYVRNLWRHYNRFQLAPREPPFTIGTIQIYDEEMISREFPKIFPKIKQTYDKIIKSNATVYNGYIVPSTTDANDVVITWIDADDAAKCCIEINKQLCKVIWPTELTKEKSTSIQLNSDGSAAFAGIRVKIGLVFGDATAVCNKDLALQYSGLSFETSAYLCEVANGGQILVSRSFFSAVTQPETGDPFVFQELASVEIDNVGKLNLYNLDVTGLQRVFGGTQTDSDCPNKIATGIYRFLSSTSGGKNISVTRLSACLQNSSAIEKVISTHPSLPSEDFLTREDISALMSNTIHVKI